MNQTPLPIPLHHLLTSAVGSMLLGFGAAKVFANVDFFPPGLMFENWGIVFMMVGAALDLPAILYLVGMKQREGKARAPGEV